jgi:glycosyltransferase involved in cell wall biosynthesis
VIHTGTKKIYKPGKVPYYPRTMTYRTLILIPARNEVATIGNLVRQIRKGYARHVVVIDDNSQDGTGHAAREAGAVVLPHTLQTGAWGAILTGFRYALQQDADIIVTMDADGQHLPDALPGLLEPVAAGRTDVAIGACPQRASTARHVAWAFFRRLSGMAIQDLTSGLRAYNRRAVAALSCRETTLLDYQDIGVLIFLRQKGFVISEVPVAMCRRASGHSRIFASWGAVFRYLVLTCVLCVAKVGRHNGVSS